MASNGGAVVVAGALALGGWWLLRRPGSPVSGVASDAAKADAAPGLSAESAERGQGLPLAANTTPARTSSGAPALDIQRDPALEALYHDALPWRAEKVFDLTDGAGAVGRFAWNEVKTAGGMKSAGEAAADWIMRKVKW